MRLKTERLTIMPLTERQLDTWLTDLQKFERALNCRYEGEPVTGAFEDIIRNQLSLCQNEANNILYHTFWLIILREERIIAGSAVFKGAPDDKGEIEIGYGLGQNHRKRGIMTESLQSLKEWALNRPSVAAITAETENNPE